MLIFPCAVQETLVTSVFNSNFRGKKIAYKVFWTFDTDLQLKEQNILDQEAKYFVFNNFSFSFKMYYY